ncbi:pspC domain protein [Synechococcus sp. SYN20]|uniref:PspC domain-containing protein n=1 Tax=Synechococcus sp. SYN20 TaxID=1050714 RepID=UPI00164957F1|nr:PspC domain-containing protein [Synechococcus sp. SYN20]QNJ27258.1 pspC domain protein [Synechococcus sp. SYN20]
MSELVRVKEGANLSGVCSGLEACDRGSATAWRLFFLLIGAVFFLPIAVYIGMAIALPQVATVEEAKKGKRKMSLSSDSGSARVTASADLSETQSKLEKELSYFKQLHERNLISAEEYDKLRKKALDSGNG